MHGDWNVLRQLEREEKSKETFFSGFSLQLRPKAGEWNTEQSEVGNDRCGEIKHIVRFIVRCPFKMSEGLFYVDVSEIKSTDTVLLRLIHPTPHSYFPQFVYLAYVILFLKTYVYIPTA